MIFCHVHGSVSPLLCSLHTFCCLWASTPWCIFYFLSFISQILSHCSLWLCTSPSQIPSERFDGINHSTILLSRVLQLDPFLALAESIDGYLWVRHTFFAGEAAARVGGRVRITGYSNLWMENHPKGGHGFGRDHKASQKRTLFGFSHRVILKMGKVMATKVWKSKKMWCPQHT